MRITLAAAVALVPWLALADGVRTGTPTKLTRGRIADVPQMVYVEPPRGLPGEVLLIGVVGELEKGDEYDVVDGGGFAARVKVTHVARTDHRCPDFFYQRARARIVEEHHDIDPSRAVAVGPAQWPRRGAQLLAWDAVRAGRAVAAFAPPAGAGPTLIHLLDLDGDGVPELARYRYDCARGHEQAWSGSGPTCLEDWTRDARGWRRAARLEFTCE